MRASIIGQICRPTSDHKQARTLKLLCPTQGWPDPGQQSDTETHPHTRQGATTCRKGPVLLERAGVALSAARVPASLRCEGSAGRAGGDSQELGAAGRHSPC